MPCIIIKSEEYKEEFRRVVGEMFSDEDVNRWGKLIQELYADKVDVEEGEEK